jgi:hypothetical protein
MVVFGKEEREEIRRSPGGDMGHVE